MEIGFITCTEHENFFPEDRLAVAALASRGLKVRPIVWDSAMVDLRGLSMIVVRTPWNYVEASDRFLTWFDAVSGAGIPVWNPPELIKWNFDKHYLLELASKGVSVVPSEIVELSALESFDKYAARFGSRKIVAKPVVSAAARNTHVVSSDAELRAISSDEKIILQPFVEEIQTEGEWSLLFFNGEFSHSLVKCPARGDFRVQEMYKGTWEYRDADAVLLGEAKKIVAAIPGQWLYARVDGVRRKGRFELMELELFEPQLFFGKRPELAERFADNIMSLL